MSNYLDFLSFLRTNEGGDLIDQAVIGVLYGEDYTCLGIEWSLPASRIRQAIDEAINTMEVN